MDFSVVGAVLGGLSGLGGLVVALNGRTEAKQKAKMTPVDLADKALEISGEWLDRLQQQLVAQERACERELARLRTEIETLREEVAVLRGSVKMQRE